MCWKALTDPNEEIFPFIHFLEKNFKLFTSLTKITISQKKSKDAQKSNRAVHTEEDNVPGSTVQYKRMNILAKNLYAKNKKP